MRLMTYDLFTYQKIDYYYLVTLVNTEQRINKLSQAYMMLFTDETNSTKFFRELPLYKMEKTKRFPTGTFSDKI